MSTPDSATLKFLRQGAPQVGDIVVHREDGEHPRPWRVLDVRDREHPEHPGVMVPVCQLRPMDRGLDMEAGGSSLDWHAFLGRSWHQLPEHYAVCRICGQLSPCECSLMADRMEEDAQIAHRFETPGVCPECLEPVTDRQGSRTFEVNLFVPAGPPVTFHTRKRCSESERQGSLRDYETRTRRMSRMR